MAELLRRQVRRPGSPRPKSHRVRVTAEQEAQLQRRAAEQRLTVARLLVESALAHEPARQADPMSRELAAEFFGLVRLLVGISTNVNQLAAVANTTGTFPPAELVAVADAVKRATKRVEVVASELGGGR